MVGKAFKPTLCFSVYCTLNQGETMSRTYKDKPWKYKNPEAYDLNWGSEKIPYPYEYQRWGGEDTVTVTRYWYKQLPGVKTKKKKSVDCEWHWLGSTPSRWTRMTMNRPQRRQNHLWEHTATHTPIDELEELDKPNVSRKPHIYYY